MTHVRRTAQAAVGIGYLETINHHHGPDGHLHLRSSEPEHLIDVSILEKELAGGFVIFLIERAAGNKDSDNHRDVTKKFAWGECKLAFQEAHRNSRTLTSSGVALAAEFATGKNPHPSRLPPGGRATTARLDRTNPLAWLEMTMAKRDR